MPPVITYNKINKRMGIIVLLILGLLIVAAILYNLIARKTSNIFSPKKTPFIYQKLNPTNVSLVDSADSLRFAYIKTAGDLVPGNQDPDLETIFIINTDGTQKKLVKLDTPKSLRETPLSIIYSPLTHEIIVNTLDSIRGVSLKDGSIRNIYNLAGHGLSGGQMSSDYHNLYLSSSTKDARGLDETQYYILDITNSVSPKAVDFILEQPYFDSSSNKVVSTEINTFHTSAAKGPIPDSTKLTIHDLVDNQEKTIVVDGSANFLFSANHFSYFFGNQGIMQLNLDTGVVSKAKNLPILPYLNQEIINPYYGYHIRVGTMVAPDGHHFFYPKGKENPYYVYNLSTHSEQSFTVDKSCITQPNLRSTFSQINFSQDSRFIIFNYDGDTVCVYDDVKAKLSVYKVPPLPSYSSVQYTMVEGM